MSLTLDKDFKEKLLACAAADPLLPRANPSISFWQEPAHPTVSSIQSKTLRPTTDIIIIGSGISSCSVTKSILENAAFTNIHVTVIDARTLTSGATGRNGGHLVSESGLEYAELAEQWGEEKAKEAIRFSLAGVERVREVVASFDDELKEASELRDVTSHSAVLSVERFNIVKDGLEKFEKAMPEHKGLWTGHEGREEAEKLGFKSAAGVFTGRQGAMWPYRLITGIFSRLLAKYPKRLTIETLTPATSVSSRLATPESPYSYEVTTPRGSIKASKIVYCTNGHTGHLLPNLRGKLFPLRGTMSTQKAGPNFPNYGGIRSWSTSPNPTLDPDTGIVDIGLIYMCQNPHTGDIFVGGEKQKVDQILISDDTVVPEIPAKHLSTILPKLFAKGWENSEPEVRQIWSGIMGFTGDAMPLVGRLTEKMTGRRDSEQEWIAAGFNGYGMDKCWLTGEALVAAMAGDTGKLKIPSLYQLSDERLESMKGNYVADWLVVEG